MIDDYKSFVAGFDLAGERRSNGRLYVFQSNESIDEWPDSISAFGNIYNLESVTKGENGYECALYA